MIGHQIEATNRQIDRLVHELYGLSEEEIVEEATAQAYSYSGYPFLD
jgi:hypothetical protein